jgi:hypothetical protein
MLWKAGLNAETTIVNEHVAYLVGFADTDETALEKSRNALEEARQKWIDYQIERRFRKSKGLLTPLHSN